MTVPGGCVVVPDNAPAMLWIWVEVRLERELICPTLLMADWMEDVDAPRTCELASALWQPEQ